MSKKAKRAKTPPDFFTEMLAQMEKVRRSHESCGVCNGRGWYLGLKGRVRCPNIVR